MNELLANLHKIFHFNSFQKGQQEIIQDIMDGNDVLGVLPTGSGKSLCYQLPAKLLPGITIVISPLISLMIDQVRQIKAHYYKEVAALHSFHDWKERKSIIDNISAYKLIFISPELLIQKDMIEVLNRLNISLFCIDEAHCISQWGYDFRPDYLRLVPVIDAFGNPPVLALTGTATPEVQEDILLKLNRPNMKMHVYSMERTNISFAVRKELGSETDKKKELVANLNNLITPTIIYFSSRKSTEQMAHYLSEKLMNRKIAFYHGGMDTEDRLKVQQQFMNDQLDIICCTSAFGMGINKKNIRLIVHYHLPTQIESFIQEVGRAGRGGEESISLLLYRSGDIQVPMTIIENELPQKKEIKFVMNQLYKLFINNHSIPFRKEKIEELFQMNEIKWRLLHYQFELHDMIKSNRIQYDYVLWKEALEKINLFCIDRLGNKRKKLQEMIDWVHHDGCLRYNLYKPFQNNVAVKQKNCCINCGNVIDHFNEKLISRHNTMGTSWQEQLKSLLLIEEINHEAK